MGKFTLARVFGRDHERVLVADLEQRIRVHFASEKLERVRAEQRKPMSLGQAVPELFEANGSGWVTVVAQQRDHLTESGNQVSSAVSAGARNDSAYDVIEPGFVGPVIDHEFGQRVGSVQRGIAAFFADGIEVESHRGQARRDSIQMGGCCNQDGRATGD